MDEQHMQLANEIAQALTRADTDPNEVASVVATLRHAPDGEHLFRYLDTVIRDGDAVVRSKRTIRYYRSIRDACRRHLTPYRDQPKTMAEVLGWAARLMRYYQIEPSLEPPPPRMPQRPEPEPKAEAGRQRGTVKWFSRAKGFGFIAPAGGGRDAFVHISNVEGQEPLSEGQKVTFKVKQDKKGPAAHDVRPARETSGGHH